MTITQFAKNESIIQTVSIDLELSNWASEINRPDIVVNGKKNDFFINTTLFNEINL